MYKAQLFALLAVSGTAYFEHEGKRYILQSIEREDGSGYKFNVSVKDENNVASVLYIRTVD